MYFGATTSSFSLYQSTANTSTSVDLTGAFPKGIATEPAINTGTHVVSWTETAQGKAPDFVRLDVYATATSSGMDRGIDWDIIAPYSGATLQLPTLVGEGLRYNLAAGDQASLTLSSVTATGGYDAVRERAFTTSIEGLVGITAGRVMTATYAAP